MTFLLIYFIVGHMIKFMNEPREVNYESTISRKDLRKDSYIGDMIF